MNEKDKFAKLSREELVELIKSYKEELESTKECMKVMSFNNDGF